MYKWTLVHGFNLRGSEGESEMGSNMAELRLDLNPGCELKTVSSFLREVSMMRDSSEKLSKLDDYVKGLEDEMRKIDGFKRELPLCMLLLNDGQSLSVSNFWVWKDKFICGFLICFGFLILCSDFEIEGGSNAVY